jgi:ubiquinone/menaquinone biosynthesis C-methylase UbiE
MASFDEQIARRSAAEYAAFLLPHLRAGMTVLDCGCGIGTITLGLANAINPGRVIGIDRRLGEFRSALDRAAVRRMDNIAFVGGDAYALPFADASFDAALAHSIVETLERPSEAIREIFRILKPDGVIGLASVDYGGLLLAGPRVEMLEKFYDVREKLWIRKKIAIPRVGRHLRSFLADAGFERIEASARYIAYGTPDAVRRFGADRARDCRDPEFAGPVVALGLADKATLAAMENAWTEWAKSADSFAAFAWCYAIARKQ